MRASATVGKGQPRQLAVAGKQGALLWDVADLPAPRQSTRLDTGITVQEIAFGIDGRTLATGGFDRLVHLSDLAGIRDARAHARELACARAGRGLDETEWHEQIPDLPHRQTCS